jgi:zinc and cadmium transporter
MNETVLITLYSLAVVASSLFGGWLPSLLHLTHVRMQLALSFVGGMMLGVGLLHMLPHSYVELESLDVSLTWMLAGLLGMFLLIRTFHFHEHGSEVTIEHDHSGDCTDHAHPHDAHVDPQHTNQNPTTRNAGAQTRRAGFSPLSWIGVAFGLSLHAFLDGIALGAGVISDAAHRSDSSLAGLGVFLAILLHKPLDALSITTLMQARNWSRRLQQTVNAGFAMMCPLGAWVFALWVQNAATAHAQHRLVGIALAVSAGVFLCISLGDLLPEVQFHRHDRLKLSAALILGVLVAYGIRFFEPPHAHRAPPPPSEEHHDGSTELVRPREMRNLGELSHFGRTL